MPYTKGYDIAFPLRDDPEEGGLFLAITSTLSQTIRSKIMLLVTTRKGTRWRRPTYGCEQIHRLFDPNDDVSLAEIKLDIQQAVDEWLPGVSITEVQDQREHRSLVLRIFFEFSEGALRKRELLELPIA